MPFSVAFQSDPADSPVVSVLGPRGQPCVLSVEELAKASGLGVLSLFDELDRLEIAGKLAWRPRNPEETLLEIVLL